VFFFHVALSGTVFSDTNRDGVRQLGEAGLAGQTVQLLDAESGDVVATTTTDSRGFYSFDVTNGLGLGSYQVQAVPAGGLIQTTLTGVYNLTRGDTFVRRADIGLASALTAPAATTLATTDTGTTTTMDCPVDASVTDTVVTAPDGTVVKRHR